MSKFDYSSTEMISRVRLHCENTVLVPSLRTEVPGNVDLLHACGDVSKGVHVSIHLHAFLYSSTSPTTALLPLSLSLLNISRSPVVSPVVILYASLSFKDMILPVFPCLSSIIIILCLASYLPTHSFQSSSPMLLNHLAQVMLP